MAKYSSQFLRLQQNLERDARNAPVMLNSQILGNMTRNSGIEEKSRIFGSLNNSRRRQNLSDMCADESRNVTIGRQKNLIKPNHTSTPQKKSDEVRAPPPKRDEIKSQPARGLNFLQHSIGQNYTPSKKRHRPHEKSDISSMSFASTREETIYSPLPKSIGNPVPDERKNLPIPLATVPENGDENKALPSRDIQVGDIQPHQKGEVDEWAVLNQVNVDTPRPAAPIPKAIRSVTDVIKIATPECFIVNPIRSSILILSQEKFIKSVSCANRPEKSEELNIFLIFVNLPFISWFFLYIIKSLDNNKHIVNTYSEKHEG